tara:strand:- start:1297 stop:2040 length:744 start_codon:yes stop_codon:yes gene_type:complete
MIDNQRNLTFSIALRSIIFNCYFYISFTLFIIFVLTPLSFLKSPKPMRRGILALINSTIFMFDKIANIKIVERGLENIPKDKGCILCSKHMSNMDAYFLYRRNPNLTAMAKKELYSVPLVGRILNKMGVLAINRGAGEAQKQTTVFAKELSKRKIPMIIFAEGTRTLVGERRPLKSGVFYYQQEEELDIIVVAHNSGVLWPKKSWIKWPGTLYVDYFPPMPRGMDKEGFMAELEKRLLDHSEELMLL